LDGPPHRTPAVPVRIAVAAVGLALLVAGVTRWNGTWTGPITTGAAVPLALSGLALLLLPRAWLTVLVLGGVSVFLLSVPGYVYDWDRIWLEGRYARYLVGGFLTTVWVSLVGMLLGLVFGFAGGLARLSRSRVLHQLAAVYVEVVRGTPFLVQIVVAYYCVAHGLKSLFPPLAPFLDDPIAVGVVTLGFFAGAYITEIVRAAVESIDRGQSEAAYAQGMTRGQVLRHVLLPQAFRRMIPPLTGELVSLVKDSSLLSIIAVSELAKRASEVQASTYKTYEVLLPLALLYLAITFPLSRLARWLELRQQA
jgi:polar amino acid transport system permease protein